MIKLTLQIIGSVVDVSSGMQDEIVLHHYETNEYDSLSLDSLIMDSLYSALTASGEQKIELLAPMRPQVSVRLFVDEEPVRATLQLSSETVQKMAAAGASFDFDPYIYT